MSAAFFCPLIQKYLHNNILGDTAKSHFNLLSGFTSTENGIVVSLIKRNTRCTHAGLTNTKIQCSSFHVLGTDTSTNTTQTISDNLYLITLQTKTCSNWFQTITKYLHTKQKPKESTAILLPPIAINLDVTFCHIGVSRRSSCPREDKQICTKPSCKQNIDFCGCGSYKRQKGRYI